MLTWGDIRFFSYFNLTPVAKVTNNLSLAHMVQMSDLVTYKFIATNDW